MHEPHKLFKPPSNPKATIWRYLSFTKFVSLLDTQSLYFARADRMNDPLEGQWFGLTAYAIKDLVSQLSARPSLTEQGRQNLQKLPDQLAFSAKESQIFTFINAWHVGEHESAAMWRMYSGEKDGVAIVSTFENLIGGLSAHPEHSVHVGMVSYVDFEESVVNYGNVFGPFLCKRKSFEFENELRAVVRDRNISSELGLRVKVDLDQLIVRVQVSPKAEDWFTDLVRSVSERYGCDKPVQRSSLYEPLN